MIHLESSAVDAELDHIAANMRDLDKAEVFAIRGPDVDLRHVIRGCAHMSKPNPLVLSHRGEPAFACGVVLTDDMPHHGFAWGFGTDNAWRVIPLAGQIIQGSLRPWLIANGVRRVSVAVLASNRSSMTWLTKYMGARQECVLPQFGRHGEPFVQMAWTIED